MKIAFVVLIGFLLAEVNAVHANDITVISLGRADQAALTKAYYRPFREATGIDVKSFSYDGQTTEFEKMAKTGKTVWDVIQVDSRTPELGCKQGLFEKLDSTKIGNLGDSIPGAVSECGVGIFAWSTALAYDASKVNGAPSSWADFWDVKKYPGKRGLRRSAKYTLEIALLADGVAPADVYKVLAVASGSCGVPRPSLVPYVTVTGAADAATASGGRSCWLSSKTHIDRSSGGHHDAYSNQSPSIKAQPAPRHPAHSDRYWVAACGRRHQPVSHGSQVLEPAVDGIQLSNRTGGAPWPGFLNCEKKTC